SVDRSRAILSTANFVLFIFRSGQTYARTLPLFPAENVPGFTVCRARVNNLAIGTRSGANSGRNIHFQPLGWSGGKGPDQTFPDRRKISTCCGAKPLVAG